MAWRGRAWLGRARQGAARHGLDKAGLGWAWRGQARLGKAGRGKAWLGQGEVGPGAAWLGMVGLGMARHGKETGGEPMNLQQELRALRREVFWLRVAVFALLLAWYLTYQLYDRLLSYPPAPIAPARGFGLLSPAQGTFSQEVNHDGNAGYTG